MKTRIKYRVWDVENKEFVDDMCLHVDGTLLCDHGRTGYCGDFVVQQFTNLLDANGKEIYEGDILKHDIGLGPIYYEVYWCEGNGQWMTTKNNGGNIGPWFDAYQIAGNICENPELTK